jgi:hypothetical protein
MMTSEKKLPPTEESVKRKAPTEATAKPRKKKKINYTKFARIDMADNVSQSSPPTIMPANIDSGDPLSLSPSDLKERPVGRLASETENKETAKGATFGEAGTFIINPRPTDASKIETEGPVPRPDSKMTAADLFSSPSLRNNSPKSTNVGVVSQPILQKREPVEPEVDLFSRLVFFVC